MKENNKKFKAENIPLLQFDKNRKSLIEPHLFFKRYSKIPSRCVLTFFQDVIDNLVKSEKAVKIASLSSEIGEHPVYRFKHKNKSFTLFHPGVGAPLAAALLEELIAMGCSKFIVCGGAGVLDKNIAQGNLIVPFSAVRDEGTSYHYLPPSREVTASSPAVDAIKKILLKHKIEYIITKTWTTDGIYRETRGKVKRRRSEGCLAVEMEAAALFAVAKFRKVKLGQILYGGDNLDADVWEDRDWPNNWSVREKLVYLSAEACALI